MWSRPFLDGLNLAFINKDPLGQKNIPQEDYLGCEEVALLKVSIKILLGHDAQNLMGLACMPLLISAIHKNVKMHNDKLAYE